MKKQNPLVSILVINYNNSKFINECIRSLKSQTYKEIEIIFFDDNSKDNSLEVIKRFKNIKVLRNKTQTKFGSFNQINGFKKSLRKSRGEIILLLDSDDFFTKNKVSKIVNFFLNNRKKKIVFDYPIIKKNKNRNAVKKKINFFKTYWGYIHPTSCISLRREYLKKILNTINYDKFTNIWMDLRFLLFSKYNGEYNCLNKNLTIYRHHNENVSAKFKKFNKLWWQRRNEAHDYHIYFMKKNNLTIKKNFDFYMTKLINKFI